MLHGNLAAKETVTEDRTFTEFNAANGLADNSAQSILCTCSGRLVISTIGQVNIYDGVGFTHIDPMEETRYPLPNYTGRYRMMFDRFSRLWLKNNHYTVCVNLTTERFYTRVDSLFQAMGVNKPVMDFFIDEDKGFWVLTHTGLYYTRQKAYYPVLKGKMLQDVIVVGKQMIEVYSDGEIAAFDIHNKQLLYRAMPYDKKRSADYSETSIAKRWKNGFFQIRNGEGDHSILLYFDIIKRKWTTIMAINRYHFHNLTIHLNFLYIPSQYGYWKYNMTTGAKYHVPFVKRVGGSRLDTDVNTIIFDQLGGMWLGTEKRGLLYAKAAVEPFTTYAWKDHKALHYYNMMCKAQYLDVSRYRGMKAKCMLRDSRGWRWIGTETGLRLQRKGKADQLFTTKQGLLNDVIHSIVEDNFHNIWVSTSYGISCVVIQHNRSIHIISYNQMDNVPAETFMNNRAMKLSDGSIVMQAIDHVVKFNPATFTTIHRTKSRQLYPKLVNVSVNGNYISSGQEYDGNVILPVAPIRSSLIRLKYFQNAITLTISAMNFFRPMQTYYRVRVQGHGDGKWKIYSFFNSKGMVDMKGIMRLPLTGLDAGIYKVEVQASFYPDTWNTPAMEITIDVEAPWWRTTGILICAFLLIAVLLGMTAYFYRRNSQMRLTCMNGERDIISRVASYLERCEAFGNEILTRDFVEKIDEVGTEESNVVKFNELMLRLAPYFKDHNRKDVTMDWVSRRCGMSVMPLIRLLSENIYRSPYYTMRLFRLAQACKLLQTGNYTVDQVANQCRFASPNFFIACFYHQYRITPKEYLERYRVK